MGKPIPDCHLTGDGPRFSVIKVSPPISVWVNLVDHVPWEHAHGGSNPLTLTIHV